MQIFTQRIVLTFLIILFSINSLSQNLLTSRKTSYYTYIYKLSQSEAKYIYKKKISEPEDYFYHTLVDSFPTDRAFTKKLPEGYYIKTYTREDKQIINIITVRNFEVFILNNNTDLYIQVYDLQGNIIPNAKVKVGGKRLRYNQKSKSYIDRKSNKKGLLAVNYNGFTAYFDLSREFNNTLIARTKKKLIYGVPLRYIWMSVRFLSFIPVDGVRSIIKRYPYGSIYDIKNFSVNTYKKVACIFDDYYCDNYEREEKFSRKHQGYIVFNKPKYKPGDTVKFKAYIIKKKKKPLKKPVNIYLYKDYSQKVKLTKLKPYKKGAFRYEFYLHDSLHLKLDRDISIVLNKKKELDYLGGKFRYEDYVLSRSKLTTGLSAKEHFKNNTLKLFVNGSDENDLKLQDARIEVLISPDKTTKYFNEYTYIPDTLYFLKRKLDPQNETEILINDSLFPPINFAYNIKVTLKTSDNEILTKKQKINYYYEQKKFRVKLPGDSILFEYYVNGLKSNTEVRIIAYDNFNNAKLIYKGDLPYSTKIQPFYSRYSIKSTKSNLSYNYTVRHQPSLLACYSERTNSTLNITIDNPRKLPFVYNIYKKNQQKAAGYTDSLIINKKTKSKQNYSISLRYIWGGAVKEDFYTIPLKDKQLNITVNQPHLVYPGQKAKIELRVSDINGKPVGNVDITAFSLTKKFHYNPPQVPELSKARKYKTIFNNFEMEESNAPISGSHKLDYQKWSKFAGLDSIEYYKFLYHGTLYRYEYDTKDSSTQFAPFVISDGKIIPVHVIYVDKKPVYFSWSTNKRPYSFKISPGYHSIDIRTTYKEYRNNKLFFEKGKKTILSIDEKYIKPNQNISGNLNDTEKRILYNYIFPYRNNFKDEFAYLENSGRIINLQASYNRSNNNNFAGPVSGLVKFKLIGKYSMDFFHEPMFEYDFAPNLLKMRSVSKNLYPDNLLNYRNTYHLNDRILTKKQLEKERNIYLLEKKYSNAKFNYPHTSLNGTGKLSISFKNNGKKFITPRYVIIQKNNDDYLEVFTGSTKTFYNLTKGYYSLFYIYDHNLYAVSKDLYVKENGNNHYNLQCPDSLHNDPYGDSLINKAEFLIFGNLEHLENKVIGRSDQYKLQEYFGQAERISGHIRDRYSEAIPGVTVLVAGTEIGTISNLDGYYSLTVPTGYNKLVFSFIGYNTEEVYIDSRNAIDVTLTESELALEEVVVTALGVKRSNRTYTTSEIVGSVAGIPSPEIKNTLQKKVTGINILPSGKTEIKIRGAASMSFDKTPLYIINDKIFTGDITKINTNVIQHIEMLDAESAMALYGSIGANGAVIIRTKPGNTIITKKFTGKGADYDAAFYESSMQSSSIRKDFSDYAFWQPALSTDKNGKAGFEVTFPDDVTNWKTYYLAIGSKKLSGQTQGSIKSYKPLMAQLALPRFLIESDSSMAIGKSLNYTPDTVNITTQLEVNDSIVFSNKRYCKNAIIDSLPIIAQGDTMEIKYLLKKDDGYFDGELREIPVFPKGLEETYGGFHVLENDTSIKLTFKPEYGKVFINAKMNALDILWDEINHVRRYRYLCNEQLASKLKVLLAAKLISESLNQEFKFDKEIDKIIVLLKKRQKNNGLWGWWDNSPDSYWISKYVLEALGKTGKTDYLAGYNKEKLSKDLVWKLEDSRNINNSIKILEILNQINASVDYKTYISKLEKAIDTTETNLNTLLRFISLKQKNKLDYKLDTLNFYKKTTLFGNIYFTDNENSRDLNSNNIQNTILAYKLLEKDTVNHEQELSKMRNYFFEKRSNRSWRNTYDAAQIITTILPDLLKDSSKIRPPKLIISQDRSFTVKEFPFAMQLNAAKSIEIKKSGTFPVYLSAYQKYQNQKPEIKKSDFEIITYFDNNSNILTAGKPVNLIVDVLIKKDAEYLMINIPIPGGCNYTDKEFSNYTEDHREYFKNETGIFCSKLNKGKYSFKIKLTPKYTGKYTLNPAKIELMYFPTFNANNELKTITINKEEK